jgi:tetratricopeptide (TPR) repeat protein
MGWIAPVLLIGLVVWWIKQCVPFQRGSERLLRSAAMICGCAFAVHGLFDVSGHRLGSIWPALFLASTAMHPEKDFRPSRALPWILRCAGLGLIAVGIWWLASSLGANTPLTSQTRNRLSKNAELAMDRRDFSAALGLASQDLKIAPLDWNFYFIKASAEATLNISRSAAVRDFAIARYLTPHWPETCFDEGAVWLGVGEPDLVFDAWAEALRRSPEQAPEMYRQMFELIKDDVSLVDRWRELAHNDRRCLLVFFQYARPFEFNLELQRLLFENPTLNGFGPDELKLLFVAWYEKGDKFWLSQLLQEHPDWRKLAWRQVALLYADEKEYQKACETLRQFAPAPKLPQSESNEPLEALQISFRVDPLNLNKGLVLCLAQIKNGQIDEALKTVRDLVALPGSPKYLFYLEAQLWAQKHDWEKAWLAWRQFDFE